MLSLARYCSWLAGRLISTPLGRLLLDFLPIMANTESRSHFMRSHRRATAVFSSLVLLPLLFNLALLWQEVGMQALAQDIRGTYACFSEDPCSLLPRIILGLSGASLLIALFAMFTIFLARRITLMKLPIALLVLGRILLAVVTGIVYRYVAGLLMPLYWLPKYGDYLLGLPVSSLAEKASWYVVFPLLMLIFMFSAAGGRKLNGNEVLPSQIQEAA